MDGRIQKHVCIKFCMKIGKSSTEMFEIFCEAFGEHSLSWTDVFQTEFTFQGQLSVSLRIYIWTFIATKPQQNDGTVEKIGEIIHEDRRQTIHELADTSHSHSHSLFIP
jgi:hypothetical protein